VRHVTAAGVTVSAIGLGTWQFGSRDWAYGTRYAEEVAPAIVDRCIELGVTFFDTAEIYAMGRSERILGRALAGRRDQVCIATKLLPLLPIGPVIRRRARGSADRLGVDVIDLYQVHWPNPVVPFSWTMPPLAALRTEGRIRHVGVSNFSGAQWRDAEAAMDGPILSNQVSYSLVNRRPERSVLPHAQEHDRLVIAYSPLAQGLLSGRYRRGSAPGGVRRNNPLFLDENLEQVEPLLAALSAIAAAHDASSAQVALAWVLRRPNVMVIPGASSVAQAEHNAEAADLELSDAEDAELTALSDAFEPVGGLEAVQKVARTRLSALAERVSGVRAGLRA